jgi:S-adenosylmethionine uptake transporter
MAARRGIVMGAAGIALMCGMDAVAKALGADLTTFQIVFVRYLGAALWLALWIGMGRGSWPRLADLPRQAMRAVLLVTTASLFFYAVGRLPIAMVAALGMTAPLYVTLLGALIFAEPISARGWTALALGVAGAGIIIFTGTALDLHEAGAPLAWAAALLAPLSYAILLVMLKHHSSREQPEAMTFGQSLIAAILALPLAFGAVPDLPAHTLGLVALIGLLGAIGFLLLINGLKLIPVSVFAVIDYTGLLWAAVFGFAFFNEFPGPQLWIGGALIISACVLTAARAPEKAPAPV